VRVAIALTILFVPTLASAQSDPAPRLASFGARGGFLSTSWDYTESDELFERGTDVAVGGFVGIGGQGEGRLSLGVLVDVLYARQRIGDAIIGQDVVREVVHVPILLKVRARRLSAGGARVYGLVGPAIDVQTRAMFGEEDVTDLYEDSLLSIVAGGGVEWGRWSIDARAAWGTSSVPKDLSGPGEIRANTFAILGGFRVR
jgi:hypothetical protein